MSLITAALIGIGVPGLPKGDPEDINRFLAKVDTATYEAKSLISGTLENLMVTGQALLSLDNLATDQREALNKENEKAVSCLERLKGVDIGNPDSLVAAIKDAKALGAEYLGLITANLTAEGAAQAISDKRAAVEAFISDAGTKATNAINKAQEAVQLAPAAAKSKGLGATKGMSFTTIGGRTIDEAGINRAVDKGAGFAKDVVSLIKETGDLLKAYGEALKGLQ
ncbi:MAG: hypothetical protein ABIN66_09105 [candidate division WOR-3 bacterium]